MVGQLLSLIGCHLSFVYFVTLIANQHTRNVLWCVLFNLVHPVLDRAEALSVRYVICHEYTMRALVVAWCNRLEALRSCRVPNLQLNRLAVHFDRADFLYFTSISKSTYEVHTDGWHEVVRENIILIVNEHSYHLLQILRGGRTCPHPSFQWEESSEGNR